MRDPCIMGIAFGILTSDNALSNPENAQTTSMTVRTLTETIADDRAWNTSTVGDHPAWTVRLAEDCLRELTQAIRASSKTTELTPMPDDLSRCRIAMSQTQVTAIDAVEKPVTCEGMHVEFAMAPGQMLFTNNRWILHNRTTFEDCAEPKRRRHFVRLWLRDRG